MHALYIEYVENGISTSVVARFLVYLAEKQAVKTKKSRIVLTWAKKAFSDVLSACCIYVLVSVLFSGASLFEMEFCRNFSLVSVLFGWFSKLTSK